MTQRPETKDTGKPDVGLVHPKWFTAGSIFGRLFVLAGGIIVILLAVIVIVLLVDAIRSLV